MQRRQRGHRRWKKSTWTPQTLRHRQPRCIHSAFSRERNRTVLMGQGRALLLGNDMGGERLVAGGRIGYSSDRTRRSRRFRGPVAQRLEQGTHNALVGGSNPSGPTCAPWSKTYRACNGPPTPRRAVASSASVQRVSRALPDEPRSNAWTHPTPARPVSAPVVSLSPPNLCFAWSTPQRVQGYATRWLRGTCGKRRISGLIRFEMTW